MRLIQPRCVFCGATGKMTGEHVFSKWTHKFLPPRSKKPRFGSIVATAYADRTDFRRVEKTGDIRDVRIYCVCESHCNNGWMSTHIEKRARLVMKPLIVGDSLRIHPDAQERIAAWAVLKAMVSEYDTGESVTVHHTHRKYLMKHHRPPRKGWGVWIGHYLRGASGSFWVTVPLRVPTKKDPPRPLNYVPTHYNSRSYTLMVGKLFVHVLHTAFPDFSERFPFHQRDGGTLFRIWPPTTTSISWPQAAMTDNDAQSVAWSIKDFYESLGEARRAVDGGQSANV